LRKQEQRRQAIREAMLAIVGFGIILAMMGIAGHVEVVDINAL